MPAQNSPPLDAPARLSRHVWLSALVLGVAFFASEHNVRQSLKNDFTEDADEMIATAEGGSPLRRLAFASLAVAGVAAFWFATERALPRPSVVGLLLAATLGWCFLSMLWAQDFGMCVRRLLVLGFCTVGVVGLSSRLTLRELCLVALLVSWALVAIGVCCEIALGTFRPWSGEYRFSGTVHPNTQGAYLACLCFSSACLGVQDLSRRKWYWLLTAAAMVLLVLTKSRTSTFGVVATLGAIGLLLNRPRVGLTAVATLVFLGAAGLLVLLLSGIDADALLAKIAFMGREEETESFNGRTTIWPAVGYYIDRSFWIGYGFESFWTPSMIAEITAECQWPVREAHSAYLDTMLSVGAIGLALLVATLLAGMGSSLAAWFRSGEVAALFLLGMGLNGLFNGMFESGMVTISFPSFITAISLVRLAQSARSAAGERTAVRRRPAASEPNCIPRFT
jgi:exopolysaccharide production protein ExoQ